MFLQTGRIVTQTGSHMALKQQPGIIPELASWKVLMPSVIYKNKRIPLSMEKCGENRRKLGETKSQGSEDSCLQGVKAPYFKGLQTGQMEELNGELTDTSTPASCKSLIVLLVWQTDC
ncbi:hypothetical protein Y1Q_0004629 [Alligator mississippiensis]|uniref:Uncharacterized protein n=1 Tax=Alligator mississippiensis TaxID=8496 RepID=A0A151MHN1_ALLMI|nr:hypothetical protein Y1Q_0004629 [Alligator mississippiensis]